MYFQLRQKEATVENLLIQTKPKKEGGTMVTSIFIDSPFLGSDREFALPLIPPRLALGKPIFNVTMRRLPP